MKFLSKLVLFLFVAFLSTPTLVLLIEKSTNTSFFYDFSEEENIKNIKEIKADIKHTLVFIFSKTTIDKSSEIISENLSKHDNVTDEIFSPPPELV